MAKREEANSGLMSGFITEDEARKKDKIFDEIDFVPEVEEPVVPLVPDAESEQTIPEPDQELKDLPEPSTIDIQGISGKVIPGLIKIVKKPKAAPKLEAVPEPRPEPEPLPEPEPVMVVVKAKEVVARVEKYIPAVEPKPEMVAVNKKGEKPVKEAALKPKAAPAKKAVETEVEKPVKKEVVKKEKKPEPIVPAAKKPEPKVRKKEITKREPLSVAERSLPLTEQIT